MKFIVYFDKSSNAKTYIDKAQHLDPFLSEPPFVDENKVDEFESDVDGIDEHICESMIRLTLAYGDIKASWCSKSKEKKIDKLDLLPGIAKDIRQRIEFFLKKSLKIKSYMHLAVKDFAPIYFKAIYDRDGFTCCIVFEQLIADKTYESGVSTKSFSDPYHIGTSIQIH